MALTQMQLIQSLGEALAWLEKEVAWGVQPTELRHLCGRIGELYACVMTNGQMANHVNQKGYDVVSANNERISVKTTAMRGGSGHISFNPKTLSDVDRVMILRVDTEEAQVETLFHGTLEEALKLMNTNGNRHTINLSQIVKVAPGSDKHGLELVRHITMDDNDKVCEYSNGSIAVFNKNMEELKPTMKYLRDYASFLGIRMSKSNGSRYNTRELGSMVIDTVLEWVEGLDDGRLFKVIRPSVCQNERKSRK